MLSRAHGPMTQAGHKYAVRQPMRLERYAAAGLPPPLVVYAEEVSDSKRLRAMVFAAGDRLGCRGRL